MIYKLSIRAGITGAMGLSLVCWSPDRGVGDRTLAGTLRGALRQDTFLSHSASL